MWVVFRDGGGRKETKEVKYKGDIGFKLAPCSR